MGNKILYNLPIEFWAIILTFAGVIIGNLITLLVTHSSNKALTEMYDVTSANKFIDLAYAYGKAIGGKKYGTLFTNRVFEIIENIPDWVTSQSTT